MMSEIKQNITLELLLQSLEDDFDKEERVRILEVLKNNNTTDEALIGAKMLLEENNWDYTVLKKVFAKTERRIEGITNTKTIHINQYLKYAAVLIPITLILGYFINHSISNAYSINQYYPKEEGLPNFMGKKTNWNDLMELYRANKMKEALVVSERILLEKQQNDTAVYFHGVIAYELKNYTVAKKDYTKITQNKKSVFYYDATYRLGFVLNSLKEVQTAKQQFEFVKNDFENPYNKDAEVVLKHFND